MDWFDPDWLRVSPWRTTLPRPIPKVPMDEEPTQPNAAVRRPIVGIDYKCSHSPLLGLTISAVAAKAEIWQDSWAENIRFGVAWVNPRDNYCRRLGRELAYEHCQNVDKSVTMPKTLFIQMLRELRRNEDAPLDLVKPMPISTKYLRLPVARGG